MSTFHEGAGTVEAFSFLRFAHASVDELALLPPLRADGDFGRLALEPVSARNELAVLRRLAALSRAQLAAYPRSLAEDEEALRAGHWPAGSGANARNALLLVRGEKQICTYYVELAALAAHLAAQPRAALEAMLADSRRDASSADADIYVRLVLLPLLLRKAPVWRDSGASRAEAPRA